ncbi:Phospholipase ddhd1 [Gryganskiella cystojenkinii]|nr:Phospholipase ddhd1 [Gryganskiella cystojenkinii]
MANDKPDGFDIPEIEQPAPLPSNDHLMSSGTGANSSTKKTLTKSDQYPHHVIFVVHGMGRQLEEFGNYERNVGYLVENTKTVLQSQFHELKTDVHIIPIEWHAKLHSMVDPRMSLTSLRTVPKVRLVMNDYFADILYYFNSHFGSEIIRMIVEELNEAYTTFMARHPDFNGKVSIYALSLGGVAVYDILTCMDDDEPEKTTETESHASTSLYQDATQSTKVTNSQEGSGKNTTASQDDYNNKTKSAADQSEKQKEKKARVRKQDQPKFRAVIPKLNFRPNFLFTVGSPVAYRIEPLIEPIFAAIPAVTLTSTTGGASQLFPGIMLPTLPSLPSVSSTLSSFWETKIPALPRPSSAMLPVAAGAAAATATNLLSGTLSHVTQSLKSGRWLPGSGSIVSSSPHVSSTSTPTLESNITRFENKDHSRAVHEHGEIPLSKRSDESNADVPEATFFNPDHSMGSTGHSNLQVEAINTTTGSSEVIASPSRRPSLGPRRISSRVEDEERDNAAAAVILFSSNPAHQVVEEEADEAGSFFPPEAVSIAAQVVAVTAAAIPALHMEYFLGMEKGPTDQERAMGEGAKSDVVQEDIVRSLQSSPTLDPHPAQHGHDRSDRGLDGILTAHVNQREENNDKGNTGANNSGKRKVTVSDEEEIEENKAHSDLAAEQSTQAGSENDLPDLDSGVSPIRVGGRATKVPYRIDHVLQETRVDQYTNEYLLGMRSHFRYWGNRDIAYHILKNMLLPPGEASKESGGVVNLKPAMPAPVTAPKNAKEAAEAKAKAAAAAFRQNQGQGDGSGHGKSFSFSFAKPTGTDRSSTPTSRQQQQQVSSGDEDLFAGYLRGYGSAYEDELYGYRFSDLDVSSAADVGSSSNTLYQNSPFMSSTGFNDNGAYQSSGAATIPVTGSGLEKNRRRSSGTGGSNRLKRNSRHDVISSSSTVSSSKPLESAPNDTILPVNSAEAGSGLHTDSAEGAKIVVQVPELARPPRLHHRSPRLDEKR